jgi:hypothetical protein
MYDCSNSSTTSSCCLSGSGSVAFTFPSPTEGESVDCLATRIELVIGLGMYPLDYQGQQDGYRLAQIQRDDRSVCFSCSAPCRSNLLPKTCSSHRPRSRLAKSNAFLVLIRMPDDSNQRWKYRSSCQSADCL